jgi:hypothetical protein
MEADLALLELAPADCMLEDCQGQRRRGRWRQFHAALSVYTYTSTYTMRGGSTLSTQARMKWTGVHENDATTRG